MHAGTDDRVLVALVVSALDGDAKDHIYTLLSEEELREKGAWNSVTSALEKRYGQDELMEVHDVLKTFRNTVRGGMDMEDFLGLYEARRAKALRYGMQPSVRTDGLDLLEAAQLAQGARADVFRALSQQKTMMQAMGLSVAEMRDPRIEDVLRLLKETARAWTTGEPKPKKVALTSTTLFTKGDKGGGKGKGSDKGKGKGGKQGKDLPCWQFSKNGSCSFGDKCRFAHVKGDSKPVVVGKQCSHCGSDKHEEKACWKAHPELRPTRGKKAETNKKR
jgi:hypothetical protein